MARGFGLDAIISVASSGSVVLFQTVFTVSLLRSFYIAKKQSDTKIFKPIQYVSLGIFIYLAIAFIIWIIEEFTYRLHHDENMWIVWYWLFFGFIALSLILFYTLMLLRLYYTFQDTHFAVSRTFIKIHSIPIVIVVVLAPMAVLVRRMGLKAMYYILLLVLMAVYGIGTLHLICVFHAKLFKFTVSMKERSFVPRHVPNASSRISPRVSSVPSSSPPHTPTHISAPSSLSLKQLEMLQTIRKQTLLGFIILLMLVLDIVVVIIYQIKPNLMFWHIAWATTMNVATLCIYLGFMMNSRKYHFCCSVCDFCCKVLCDYIAERKVSAPKRMPSDSVGVESPSSSPNRQESIQMPDILDLDKA